MYREGHTPKKRGNRGCLFEPAVRRGVAGGVDKDFLDRRGLIQSLSVTVGDLSDIPGDPGSQFPYQEFPPYYLAPI